MASDKSGPRTGDKRQGIDMGMLPDLIGFNLRCAQLALFQHFGKTVGQDGISAPQFGTLLLIEANPAMCELLFYTTAHNRTRSQPLCTGVSRRCMGVSAVPAVGPVRSVPSPPALSTRTPRWSPAGGPPRSSHPHEVTETAAVTRFLPTTTQPGVRIGGGGPVQPARGAAAQEPEQQRQHSGPATLPLRDDRPARRCRPRLASLDSRR